MVGGLDQSNFDRLPFVNAVVGLGENAFDAHLPRAHQPLHAVGGVIAKVPNEKTVDPYAVQIAFDGQFGHEGIGGAGIQGE